MAAAAKQRKPVPRRTSSTSPDPAQLARRSGVFHLHHGHPPLHGLPGGGQCQRPQQAVDHLQREHPRRLLLPTGATLTHHLSFPTLSRFDLNVTEGETDLNRPDAGEVEADEEAV